MTENPGYLKLRKIRAAQHIAQTVSLSFVFKYCVLLLILFRYLVLKIECT